MGGRSTSICCSLLLLAVFHSIVAIEATAIVFNSQTLGDTNIDVDASVNTEIVITRCTIAGIVNIRHAGGFDAAPSLLSGFKITIEDNLELQSIQIDLRLEQPGAALVVRRNRFKPPNMVVLNSAILLSRGCTHCTIEITDNTDMGSNIWFRNPVVNTNFTFANITISRNTIHHQIAFQNAVLNDTILTIEDNDLQVPFAPGGYIYRAIQFYNNQPLLGNADWFRSKVIIQRNTMVSQEDGGVVMAGIVLREPSSELHVVNNTIDPLRATMGLQLAVDELATLHVEGNVINKSVSVEVMAAAEDSLRRIASQGRTATDEFPGRQVVHFTNFSENLQMVTIKGIIRNWDFLLDGVLLNDRLVIEQSTVTSCNFTVRQSQLSKGFQIRTVQSMNDSNIVLESSLIRSAASCPLFDPCPGLGFLSAAAYRTSISIFNCSLITSGLERPLFWNSGSLLGEGGSLNITNTYIESSNNEAIYVVHRGLRRIHIENLTIARQTNGGRHVILEGPLTNITVRICSSVVEGLVRLKADNFTNSSLIVCGNTFGDQLSFVGSWRNATLQLVGNTISAIQAQPAQTNHAIRFTADVINRAEMSDDVRHIISNNNLFAVSHSSVHYDFPVGASVVLKHNVMKSPVDRNALVIDIRAEPAGPPTLTIYNNTVAGGKVEIKFLPSAAAYNRAYLDFGGSEGQSRGLSDVLLSVASGARLESSFVSVRGMNSTGTIRLAGHFGGGSQILINRNQITRLTLDGNFINSHVTIDDNVIHNPDRVPGQLRPAVYFVHTELGE